ncbi:MAG: NAD(P)-binding domain-containing protein [Thaumarchaeota archaeon]|nr:NAD(P)-binding domain-containing protein [Nitrososphaerota archaeon]
MTKIYMADSRPITGKALDVLNQAGEISSGQDTGEADFIADMKRINPEIIIAGARKVTRDVMAAGTNLRGIVIYGVSYDFVDAKAATEMGIIIANTPGVMTISVAEFTLGLILAMTKDIARSSAHTKNGEWSTMTTYRFQFNGVEISSRTVGIIGLGKIGTHLAKILNAMGAKVVSYTKHPSSERAKQANVQFVELDQLMAESDIVVLTALLTDETKGMVTKRHIDMMKPGAYFVNIARGAMADEEAVIAALKAGKLAGAAFDVLTKEPNTDSPLYQLENTVVAPHIAGRTREANQRLEMTCAQEALRISKGERPANLVNPDALQRARK